MEFGALQYTPKKAQCISCPFQPDCVAYHTQSAMSYPVKLSKTKVKEVFYHFIVLEHNGEVMMTQRDDSGLWKRLWHFPLIESEQALQEVELLELVASKFSMPISELKLSDSWHTIHLLSQRKIQARFWTIKAKHAPDKNDIFGYSWNEVENLALPQLMVKYLKQRKDVGE